MRGAALLLCSGIVAGNLPELWACTIYATTPQSYPISCQSVSNQAASLATAGDEGLTANTYSTCVQLCLSNSIVAG